MSKRKKGVVIATLAAALCAVVYFAYQLLFPNIYNYTVLLAVEGAISLEQIEALEQSFENYSPLAENGRRAEVTIKAIVFEDLLNPTNQASAREKENEFRAQLVSGESTLMILDDTLYDYVSGKGYLRRIATVYPNNLLVEGSRYYFHNTPFAQERCLLYLPDDLSICIRNAPGAFHSLTLNGTEYYAYMEQVLDNIINDRTQTVQAEDEAID